MLKAVGVLVLVFVEIGGIYKEIVFFAQDIIRIRPDAWQAVGIWLSNHVGLAFIPAQTLPVLKTQPRRCIAVAVHQTRPPG